MLVVFAAGNCGDTSTDDLVDNCSVLDDDEGTVLSPAQGKNVVAVGSSESGGVTGKDMDTVSYFSSKGPTIDGRIKPDVVAPGDPTWSAAADPTGESCAFGSQTVREDFCFFREERMWGWVCFLVRAGGCSTGGSIGTLAFSRTCIRVRVCVCLLLASSALTSWSIARRQSQRAVENTKDL